MNESTPPTIECPICTGVARATTDEWGKTEGWACGCGGTVQLTSTRDRKIDLSKVRRGMRFDLRYVEENIDIVVGQNSPDIERVEGTMYKVVD